MGLRQPACWNYVQSIEHSSKLKNQVYIVYLVIEILSAKESE